MDRTKEIILIASLNALEARFAALESRFAAREAELIAERYNALRLAIDIR